MSCQDCIYSKLTATDLPVLECHRGPPKAHWELPTDHHGHWVPVDPTDVCGEFTIYEPITGKVSNYLDLIARLAAEVTP